MNGILVIDKPEGLTSRDVVNIVSKQLHTTKVGHTGTLDPLATGVLVLAVGQATKIIELLTSNDKEYLAQVQMGIKTDTLDVTGNVLLKKTVETNILEKIPQVLESFQGTYLQEVPIYSAVKVKGKRLYEYARSGQVVALPKRNVTIKKIDLVTLDQTTFTFSCHVSKGTYIRSLIRDIGKKLELPCTMKNLRRTKQGIFSLEDAFTMDDIERENYRFISILDALKDYPKAIVNSDIEKKVRNGVVIPKCFDGKLGVICNQKNELLAIYQENEKDKETVKPWKVFS